MAGFKPKYIADILRGEMRRDVTPEVRTSVRNITKLIADRFVQADARFSREQFYIDSGLNKFGQIIVDEFVTPKVRNPQPNYEPQEEEKPKLYLLSLRYANALTKKFRAGGVGGGNGQTFKVQNGYKFDKVIIQYNDSSSSIHCFINKKTGDVIKAASFKAPQRDSDGNLAVRYNIARQSSFDNLVEMADTTGYYLRR